MSFGVLNAVLVMGYCIISKCFFLELHGASYFFGLALCVIAAKIFASGKKNPAGDEMIFRLLFPFTGLAMIIAGIWFYPATEAITASESDIVQASGAFPEEVFTLFFISMGGIILILSMVRMLKK
ncbi:hypothetical protein [Pantoea sp. FN0302]|uniref:hypothetical protein n=1 Tax=Pantoea sp. FN0302 TaxID=3418558 RepID=UPI003CF74389